MATEWTVENNLVLTPPLFPLPTGTTLLDAVLFANPGVTIVQETWTDGSAYKRLPGEEGWEVKTHIFSTLTGKRGITRHSVIADLADSLLLIPTIVAIELGIGLDALIKEVKDKPKKDKPENDRPNPR